MRFIILIVSIFFMVGPASAHDGSVDFTDTVRKVTPSIVGIATYQAIRSPRVAIRGTGFVVYDGLHVVTNAHVFPGKIPLKAMEKVVVLVGRGSNPDIRDASVVKVDEGHDLALLKISGKPLPSLKLGHGGLVPAGTEIGFTGFPIGGVLGLYAVSHRGIISAVTPIIIPQPTARYLDIKIISRPRYDVYQLDATAYPGNSGSPLYDSRTGRIEGIINSVRVKGTKENALTKPSGISFAIPVIYLHDLLRSAGLVK